jgi:hypothetical protein
MQMMMEIKMRNTSAMTRRMRTNWMDEDEDKNDDDGRLRVKRLFLSLLT